MLLAAFRGERLIEHPLLDSVRACSSNPDKAESFFIQMLHPEFNLRRSFDVCHSYLLDTFSTMKAYCRSAPLLPLPCDVSVSDDVTSLSDDDRRQTLQAYMSLSDDEMITSLSNDEMSLSDDEMITSLAVDDVSLSDDNQQSGVTICTHALVCRLFLLLSVMPPLSQLACIRICT